MLNVIGIGFLCQLATKVPKTVIISISPTSLPVSDVYPPKITASFFSRNKIDSLIYSALKDVVKKSHEMVAKVSMI